MPRLWIIAVLSALISTAFAAPVVLETLDGKAIEPFGDSNAKAVVLIFTRSDCPISNRYAPELERLYEKFGPGGIAFWLVYVDPGEARETIRKHVRDYGYRFGALLDRKHQLTAIAKASVTPEAAVFVAGKLVYRGRIDDRYVSFGKARQQATEHDLEQSLTAVVSGHIPPLRTTHAIGCFIEDLK